MSHANPTFDVFAGIRERALTTGTECECVRLAHKAALSMPRTWSEHVASFDWFLTYYGRKQGLE